MFQLRVLSNTSTWTTGDQLPVEHGFWKDRFVAICDPEPNNNKKGKDMSSNKEKDFPRRHKSSGPVILPGRVASVKKDKYTKPRKSAKPDLKILR